MPNSVFKLSSDWDWAWAWAIGMGVQHRYNLMGHYPLTFKSEDEVKMNQVDSNNNNLGESNMIKEKVIKNQ